MALTYDIDDSRLQELWKGLTEDERRKALRSALRTRANALKRKAIECLREGVGNVRDKRALEKGVRAKVWKKKVGFTVTASYRKKGVQGFYPSKSPERLLPVLVWLEYGTKARSTKGGRRTGSIEAVNFMRKARDTQAGIITNNVSEELKKYIVKMAAKAAAKAS